MSFDAHYNSTQAAMRTAMGLAPMDVDEMKAFEQQFGSGSAESEVAAADAGFLSDEQMAAEQARTRERLASMSVMPPSAPAHGYQPTGLAVPVPSPDDMSDLPMATETNVANGAVSASCTFVAVPVSATAVAGPGPTIGGWSDMSFPTLVDHTRAASAAAAYMAIGTVGTAVGTGMGTAVAAAAMPPPPHLHVREAKNAAGTALASNHYNPPDPSASASAPASASASAPASASASAPASASASAPASVPLANVPTVTMLDTENLHLWLGPERKHRTNNMPALNKLMELLEELMADARHSRNMIHLLTTLDCVPQPQIEAHLHQYQRFIREKEIGPILTATGATPNPLWQKKKTESETDFDLKDLRQILLMIGNGQVEQKDPKNPTKCPKKGGRLLAQYLCDMDRICRELPSLYYQAAANGLSQFDKMTECTAKTKTVLKRPASVFLPTLVNESVPDPQPAERKQETKTDEEEPPRKRTKTNKSDDSVAAYSFPETSPTIAKAAMTKEQRENEKKAEEQRNLHANALALLNLAKTDAEAMPPPAPRKPLRRRPKETKEDDDLDTRMGQAKTDKTEQEAKKTKAKSEQEAKLKADAEAKHKADAEAKHKADSEAAKVTAEEQVKSKTAKAKSKKSEESKAEESRTKADQESKAKAKADAEIKSKVERESKAKAKETKAKAKETKAKAKESEAEAEAEAAEKAKSKAETAKSAKAEEATDAVKTVADIQARLREGEARAKKLREQLAARRMQMQMAAVS